MCGFAAPCGLPCLHRTTCFHSCACLQDGFWQAGILFSSRICYHTSDFIPILDDIQCQIYLMAGGVSRGGCLDKSGKCAVGHLHRADCPGRRQFQPHHCDCGHVCGNMFGGEAPRASAVRHVFLPDACSTCCSIVLLARVQEAAQHEPIRTKWQLHLVPPAATASSVDLDEALHDPCSSPAPSTWHAS